MPHQPWEYCSIHPEGTSSVLTYYTPHGEQTEPVEDLGGTIARLGDAGWEMAAINPRHTVYFKRPKAEATSAEGPRSPRGAV
jgi:hypothetical protein